MKKLSAKLGDSMSTTFGCNDEKTNQVKKCYRKNAMIYHSDKHVNSTQEVKDTAGDNFKLLGLITAFDSIESLDKISTEMFASGIKVSLLTLVFGAFTFVVTRVGLLILKMLQKP